MCRFSKLLLLCLFVAHTRAHKTQVLHLQLQDERSGEKGKRQEYGREHELRMRAQQTDKSGHEYQCKCAIEYTTFLPSDL